MKVMSFFTKLAVFAAILLGNISYAQVTDTMYLNLTHEMSVQGYVISTSLTKRMAYTLEGANFLEEKVETNMSYPDESGAEYSIKSLEEFVAINGVLNTFEGAYTSNDSITQVRAEKDGESLVVMGKLHGDYEFTAWDQQEMKEIDAFIVFFDLDKLNLKKEIQTRKMYDLYGIQMRDNKLAKVGSEKVKVAGQTFDCSIVTFDYGLIKGKLWFSKDKAGNYFVVKEEAISSDYGPFEMKLSEINEKKPLEK